MFTRLIILLSSIVIPAQEESYSVQNSSLSEADTEPSETLELAQEAFFSEEDELSVIPKKGHRPQVIQTPKKSSNSP